MLAAEPALPRRHRMTKVFVDNDEVFRHYERMASKPPRPTEAELAILQVLWEAGPHSVREIQQILNQTKPTGYTTVLKMLQIMTEKGLVVRDESRRPQIYRPRQAREQTQQRLLGDLVHRAFGGSVKALVLQALATKKSTPEELEAIEKLLDRMEGDAK
jgi:predicted transcriptional regulator